MNMGKPAVKDTNTPPPESEIQKGSQTGSESSQETESSESETESSDSDN